MPYESITLSENMDLIYLKPAGDQTPVKYLKSKNIHFTFFLSMLAFVVFIYIVAYLQQYIHTKSA